LGLTQLNLNLNLELLSTGLRPINLYFADYSLVSLLVAFVSSGEGSDSKKLSVFQHAVKVYNEPLNQRSLIRKDNNGLVGVYAWVNRVNHKIYVGSGDPLNVRLSDYFQS
jgi:hypothetical protein